MGGFDRGDFFLEDDAVGAVLAHEADVEPEGAGSVGNTISVLISSCRSSVAQEPTFRHSWQNDYVQLNINDQVLIMYFITTIMRSG